MEFWAYPYLIPYLLMFFVWMLGTHRQILFWLYLWQLKEYHSGRFLAHFETTNGKSIFLNPIFVVKVAVLILGSSYFIYFHKFLIMITAIFVIFLAQAIYSLWVILRSRILGPVITKKSLMLIAASHVFIFGIALVIFNIFLGEMSLVDFLYAAIFLLLIDIFLPLLTGLVVLALQPLTVWEKNRILNKAKKVIISRPDLITIGIAGSYSKSSTKELLAAILETKFKVLKTPANLNTEIGVAQTIINDLKPEHQVFVCEIGAVHKGRIKQVGDILKPKIGILAGINQQHLGVFGSQQNIIDAKYEILEVLSDKDKAILNWDSRLVRDSFESQKNRIKCQKIIFCSSESQKDIWAEAIEVVKDHLSIVVKSQDGDSSSVMVRFLGRQNVEPILLAAAAAKQLGMNLSQVATALEKIDISKYGMQVIKNNAGVNIISSVYSSNPDSVIAHLDNLKLWPGKKAIVMPCIIELGKTSKQIHFEIGKKIAGVCDLAIVTTKDRFGEIKRGALSAGMKKENVIFAEKPVAICNLIKNRLSSGDTILLEGRLSDDLIMKLRSN